MKKIFPIILTAMLLVMLASPVTAKTANAYSGIPTFSIVSVEEDDSVTIKTYNFPANDSFTVTMGAFGTLGIGGSVIGKTSSGKGGAFTVTYSIPDSLKGSYRISIRLQSPTTGYYAYNWFYNNTNAGEKPPKPPVPPTTPGYSGYPWFTISAVVRDDTVTIKGYNFPPDDTFKVLMGPYGSYGIGGVSVDSTETDDGGSFTATYSVPDSLAGSYRIAIRLQSSASGYYAYNWFYNNTTP